MEPEEDGKRGTRAPRRKRPAPEREGPDRAGFGRTRGRTPEPPPSPAAARDAPEVVADAVRLGYRVIEENLRQGRDAADRFRADGYRLEDAQEDVVTLGRRVMGLARELGSGSFDLLAAVLDDPRLREAVRSRAPSAPDRGPVPPTPPRPADFAVLVLGHPSATGEAVMEPLTGLSGPPQPTPLRPVPESTAAAPITGVRLGVHPDTGAHALLVPVPPDQPPGVYAGTVHDPAGRRLLGSLSVTVPAV